MTVTLTWSLAGTVAATLIFVVAVLPATWAVARGDVWASPVTWTAWAALGLVAFGSALEMNVGAAAVVQTAVLGASAILMAVAAWFAAFTGIAPESEDPVAWMRPVNWVCGIGAGLAFVALIFTGAEAATWLTIATDFIAFVPTLIGAWRDPMDQPWWLFFGVALSTALTILAAGRPAQMIDVAYLLYVFVQTTVMALTILIRQWQAESKPRYYEGPTVEIPRLEPPAHSQVAYNTFVRPATARSAS